MVSERCFNVEMLDIQVYAGGSIFVHAYGAYFGIMVGLTMMFRNYDYTEDKQGTTATTDVFSLLGKIHQHTSTNN